MMFFQCGVQRQIATIIFAVMSINTVYAAEWYMEPSANLRSEYNSNPTMTTIEQKGVGGAFLYLAGNLGVRSEHTDVSIKPVFHFNRYKGENELDSNDQNIDLFSTYSTPHSIWKTEGNYTHNTTLTSEIEDTGIVQVPKRRNNWSLNPSWAYDLTERTNMELAMGYNEVTYQNAKNVGLFNYNVKNAQITLIRELSEVSQSRMILYGSRFDVPDILKITNDYGIQAEYTRDFIRTHTTFMIGYHRSRYRYQVVELSQRGLTLDTKEDSKEGFLLGISATRSFLRSLLDINLNRSIEPSGAGVLVRRDRAEINLKHDLTAKASWTLNVLYSKYQTLQKSTAFSRREYDRAFLNLAWRISKSWFANLSYSYTQQKYKEMDSTAHANVMAVLFTYNAPQRSISR